MARTTILFVTAAVVLAACATDTTTGGSPVTPSTTAPSAALSPSTTTTPTTDPVPPGSAHTVEIATINVLHGNPAASGCLAETDNCLAPTRVAQIWRMLETDVGCPEIIALQEIDLRWAELVVHHLPDLCDGTHVLLAENVNGVDEEMILTTLPVIDHRRLTLAGGPIWSAQWAQLDAGDGVVVDLIATHYASSSLDLPCGENPLDPCSTACAADLTMGGCHPIQTLELLDELAAPGSLQLVVGDLNAAIDDDRIRTLLDAGFVDTHTLAGNPPCPPEGGPGCTSGVSGDTPLDGLDVADQTLRTRIDFVLARPPAGCAITVDGEGTDETDTDGDGTHTGIWADDPFAHPVEGLFWASDHAGIEADIGLSCA